MRRSSLLAIVICCTAVFGLAACSSSSSKSSDTGKVSVTIKDLKFSVSTVKAGSTVTVKNDDGFTHTVTADDGSFNVSVDGNGQATFKAPDKAGQFNFHCNIHPTMKATLTVD